MADPEDIARLKAGERDLARSDFRKANFEAMDLSQRDLTGAQFEGVRAALADFSSAILNEVHFQNVNADAANFSGAQMRGCPCNASTFRSANFRDASVVHSAFMDCNFSEADFSGADLSHAQFQDGCNFTDCISDERTLFDGVKISRSLIKLPVFRFYTMARGVLVRIDDTSPNTVSGSIIGSTSSSTSASGALNTGRKVIERHISQKPDEIALMALSLSAAIAEQIEEMEAKKPNDASVLEAYNGYIDFLKQLAGDLLTLSDALRQVGVQTAPAMREEALSRSARVVEIMADHVEGWAKTNGQIVIDFGFRSAMLCAGTSLLSLCGVPPVVGMLPFAAYLSGSTLFDGVKLWLTKSNNHDEPHNKEP